MFERLMQYLRREDGATAVEYGLMVALIAGVIVLVVTALGQSVGGAFDDVNSKIEAGEAVPVTG